MCMAVQIANIGTPLPNAVTPRYKDPARIEAENNARAATERAAALANNPDHQALAERDTLIDQVRQL